MKGCRRKLATGVLAKVAEDMRIWRGWSVEEMTAAMAMAMGDDGRSDGGGDDGGGEGGRALAAECMPSH